jgi:CHAT domain-containing protein/Tfp pilus assembly protein PilF
LKLLAVASFLAPSWARRFLLSLFLGLVALCLACVTAPPSVPDPSPAPAEQFLDEGRPVERTLGGGERHEHRLVVEAGWYVRLEVEQIGVDVAASLFGPDGAPLFSTDDPDGFQERDKEVLALVAPATGELRLVLDPRDPQAAPGVYRVELAVRRPAGPGDAERAAAQMKMAGAWRHLLVGDEPGKREAIRLLDEAAQLWSLAGEIETQIEVLNELGSLQISLTEIRAALASLEHALSLSVQTGDREWQAFAQNNLAAAYEALGEHAQALDHYQRALPIWRETGNVSGQGRVLYGMGIIHRDRGDLDQALRYLSEALPLRQKVQDQRNALLALAIVHLGRGEMELASGCLDEALKRRPSTGEDQEGPVLATEAQFHRHRGELGEALARLREARDLYHRTGNERYEVRILHQLGRLYLDLGDLEGAQESYRQGLDLVAGKSSEAESRFLNSLGWTLYLRGNTEEALRFLERALTLSRERNLPVGIAQALNSIGLVHLETGRAREGLALLQEELAVRRQNGDRVGEARSLLALGRAWQALADLEQAAVSFQEALELGRQVGDTDLVAACLYRWAVLDRQRGDFQQALDRVEEAVRIIESVRSRVTSEKLRITFLASKRAWYELYIDLQMRLEEREPGRGHLAAALAASERARARGLLDLIAEGRINVQEGIAPDLKQREIELGARLSWIQERLGEALAQSPDKGRVASLLAQRDQVGEEMERLEEEIRRRHPRYAEVRYPAPLRLEQVAGLLDGRTALLEYFVGREASFLFVVSRSGLSAYRLPSEDVLESKVQDLRRTLEQPGILALGRFRLAAGDLYDTLLGPAGAQLAHMPTLLISPDGPLSLIPFESLLVDPARGTSYRNLAYLIRDHAISYVPSASVLDGLREPRPAPLADAPPSMELVAFGDPIYPSAQVASDPLRGDVSPWTVADLPGSGREVQAIADLYSTSEVALYLRENATEENVKANRLLQNAQRIHFATHGVVDEAHPHLSGLILTFIQGSQEDGLLQVHEIFNLRLNADLVALSACETGLGERVTGEGMVGLTRAFLYSGARSLLVSLWPVSDLSTPELMTGFYRHLRDSGTKADALRRAKLERIEQGDEPYRWAPFILAGESR